MPLSENSSFSIAGQTNMSRLGTLSGDTGVKQLTNKVTSRQEDKSEVRQVRVTGQWSADSKLSAIHCGYWEDPFFRFFNLNDPSKIRRTSLICRGYYVRFRVCDYFFRNLIKSVGKPVQVVSLGCGMDACYFRVLPELELMISKFYEVDFKSVIKAKMSIIAHNQVLRLMANEKLKLLACDLRNVVILHETLKNNGFDFNQPTLFYSECVVNYLGPNETRSILEWITANVPNSIWLAYEQCNALDGFGQIMLSHFLKNGCPLLSLISAHSKEDQEMQLKKAGFRVSQVVNAWDAFIKIGNESPPHFPRLKTSEHQFDEYEQLIATCLHYSVRVGINGSLARTTSVMDFLEKFHMLVPTSHLPGVRYESIKDSIAIKLDVIPESNLPTLSGHETVLTQNNTLLTLGGCGENSVRMKHLIRSRIMLDNSEASSQSKEDSEDATGGSGSKDAAFNVRSKILLENADHYERIHSRAVFIPADMKTSENHDSVLIFGGRKSPSTPCSNDLIELNINKIDSKVNIASVIVSSKFDGSCPRPRWRHSMSLCSKGGSLHMLLFGGRCPETVLHDTWIYSVDDFTWSEVLKTSVQNLTSPSGRHSHVTTADIDSNVVYMVGGISDNDTTLCEDSFWSFDMNSNKWTHLDEWDPVGRRVGHSVIKNKNSLVIVGGYGADSSYGFDFLASILDLENNVVKIVTQALPLNEIYLPFGFSTSLLKDEKTNKSKLVIFGGGGNCFSFGTHFNKVCLVLTLSE